MKVKLALCYNALIEKLGPKIKFFKEIERLVLYLANLLNESALEVRNMAKMAFITLSNAL